jgi:hypothetical protein
MGGEEAYLHHSWPQHFMNGGVWLASHSREKNLKYPLDERLGRPQSRSGHGGEKKIPCPYWESNPGRPACSRSLYLLRYHGSTLIVVYVLHILISTPDIDEYLFHPQTIFTPKYEEKEVSGLHNRSCDEGRDSSINKWIASIEYVRLCYQRTCIFKINQLSAGSLVLVNTSRRLQ